MRLIAQAGFAARARIIVIPSQFLSAQKIVLTQANRHN
jgi:hypothetical protein